MLQELLRLSFEGGITRCIGQYDRGVDRYRKTNGETSPPNIRIGMDLRMLPDGALRQHPVRNSGRLIIWDLLKADIFNMRRAQAVASNDLHPMDLSQAVPQAQDPNV